MKWIYNMVTRRNPLRYKFGFSLWTRCMIQALISKRLGIKLSLTSIGSLLEQMGLTCQQPLTRAFQQNAALVERWLKEEYPAIRAPAHPVGAQIFFGDEQGVRSDFHARKTRAPKGQSPVVRVTGARFGFNTISAISPKGQVRFMLAVEKVAGQRFSDLIRLLVRNASRAIFIVEDHPIHRSARVKRPAASMHGKIELLFLPSYCPELNPHEHVSNDLKNTGPACMAIADADAMKHKMIGYLKHIQQVPQLFPCFFRAPSTSYALSLLSKLGSGGCREILP